MKKNNKSFLAIALSSVLTLSMLTACGGGGGNSSSGANGGGDGSSSAFTPPANASVLNIAIFKGGLGSEWATKLESGFEQKYANYSFEEGKMGVDVQIDARKEVFDRASKIITLLSSSDTAADMYYTCANLYNDTDAAGLLMNMKDLVQEKAYTESGELADGHWDSTAGKWVYDNATKSIEDKMKDSYKDAFWVQGTTADASGYYALPFETSITGFIYDHDLFVNMGWLNDSTPDGLPSTMEEFWELMDTITQAGYICYTSGPSNYWDGMDAAFFAQYEGFDKAALDYTYDGEYTFEASQAALMKSYYAEQVVEYNASVEEEDKLPLDVEDLSYVTVNGDGSYTVDITPESAWTLAYTKGKQLHANFMRDITDVAHYHQYLFNQNMYDTTYNFEKSQEVFIKSCDGEANASEAQIAMIVEGEWWENEANANGYFNTTGGYGFRDFRFMPIPRIEGQKSSGRSLGMSAAGTDLVVNAKTKQKELCRLWLQYSHTESALETFTLTNGCVRDAFKYDLSTTQQAQLTPFAQNVYRLKTDETDDVTIYAPANYSNNHSFYTSCEMGGFGNHVGSKVKGEWGTWQATQNNTWSVMYGNAGVKGKTFMEVEDFLDGMYNHYTIKNWMTAYNTWEKQQQK